MKALIVNHSDPFATGGGSFASHAYCRAFSDIFNGNVDITIFEESKFQVDPMIKVSNYLRVKRRPFIHRIISIFTGDIQRYTTFIKNHLKNNVGVYDFVVLNGSYEGGALVEVCKNNGVKVITIHHNYDPQYAYDNISIPLYREIYTHHVYNLQRKAYRESDINLFLTKQDLELCKNNYGETSAKNEIIGVFDFKDIETPNFSMSKSKKITFVITGSLCTLQGVDGIKFFFRKLYKHLPQDATIIISGRSPKKDVIDICAKYDNVQLIPNPENMNSVISVGDIYICPTRLGGGLKLRVLDGLRLGLPVITHTCSSRGYDEFKGHDYFRPFNDENEFVNVINDIISLYKNNKIDKEIVYKEFVRAFSYKSGLERLKKILRSK